MTDIENLDGWEIETPEKDNSHTDQDAEELTKERYKQQIAWSKAEAERLRGLLIERETQNASKDANSLLELHGTDPKLANEVAKKFWYDDFNDAKTWIDWNINSKMSQKEWSWEDMEQQFEKMYQKRKSEELHELSLKKAEKIIKKLKDDDLQEKAQAYFDKITKGKKLSIDDAEEFAEMATLYVNKDTIKSEKYNQWLANFASTWMSNSKKATAQEWSKMVVVNWRLVNLPSNNTK